MPVDFREITLGELYDRPSLAKRWGYKSFHAIAHGACTPKGDNKIILFITRQQQAALTQYENSFDGNVLRIEGETDHRADDRIIKAATAGDEIHLFYRDRDHTDFVYYGIVHLQNFERQTRKPSRFEFSTSRSDVIALSALATDQATYGNLDDDSEPSFPEGSRRLSTHWVYERNRKNRERAIAIHGTNCKCCGFDFNKFYGADLARDYIQVHHIESITKPKDRVDPKTDLVPLCSNCHSMVHRVSGEILSVDRLKSLIREQSRKRTS